MKKHLTYTLFTFLLGISCQIQAQNSIEIDDYLPNTIGDRLEYQQINAADKSTFFVDFKQKGHYSELGLLLYPKGLSTQYLEYNDKKSGWRLSQIITGQQYRKVCERPLQILPAEVTINEEYRDEVSFHTFENGIVQKKNGRISSSVKVLPVEEAETALGLFDNCLVLKRNISQKMGKKIILEEWEEYYSKGVGLVKASCLLYSIRPKTGKVLEQQFQISLDKAIIQGVKVAESE